MKDKVLKDRLLKNFQQQTPERETSERQTPGIYVVNTYSITSPRKVSIRVQPVCYQSQPELHDPHCYNPVNNQHHYHQARFKQVIASALNATQGHKHSYQQAITLALNATQGHQLSYQQAITLALNATLGHKQAITFHLLNEPCLTSIDVKNSSSFSKASITALSLSLTT